MDKTFKQSFYEDNSLVSNNHKKGLNIISHQKKGKNHCEMPLHTRQDG